MNKSILMGRLTRNPEIRYSQGEKSTCVARYTLAVNRRFHKDGEQDADFINCVAFGRNGEFAEKYFQKGTKIVISGRIQTGSYTNRDGVKVYTTDVVVEEQDFAESKAASQRYTDSNQQEQQSGYNNSGYGSSSGGYGSGGNQEQYQQQSFPKDSGGFMSIPDNIDDELPFI
ncbi:MAG: single-stranded DNA-binding protein [Clostridiales bacterium]|nr:single-stranded DNA-binding protein [Clostridiales bacterium]